MIKLYHTNCPKCKVLEAKLNQKKIKYEEITDTELMMTKGFMEVPKLELNDGTILSFNDAIKWVNQQ